MQVIYSNRTRVFENLAAEDVLLDDSGSEPVALIYRNEPSVILGKNQNPWKEAAVSALNGLGVTLARRVSGGGTVFHDEGNLNIACIVPRAQYQRCDMLQLFIKGLAAVGVKAAIAGGTSLVVDGRKISGNAFCYRRDNVLHHGTLLWRANLDLLHEALTPELPDISTRAVASAPMPVVNLSQLLPGRSPDEVVKSILLSLSSKWGRAETGTVSPFEHPAFTDRVEKLSSWGWLYGGTPDFECVIDSDTFHVHRGIVISVNGDEQHTLAGQPFAAPE